MTSLLELLHSCPITNLTLRTEILRCLMAALKESHRYFILPEGPVVLHFLSLRQELFTSYFARIVLGKHFMAFHSSFALNCFTIVKEAQPRSESLSRRCRTVFRRVGGFVYLMSVLVGMEGSLAVPSPSTWASADRRAVFSLLHQTFATFATAMRYEPANAKFFYQEIAQASLAQALKMLGCFSSESGLRHLVKPPDQELLDRLHAVFMMELPHSSYVASSLPPMLESCCLLLRLLHDLAVDAFKPRLRSKASTPASCSTPPPSLSTQVKYTHPSQTVKQKLLEFCERSERFDTGHPGRKEEALRSPTEPAAGGRPSVGSQRGARRHPPASPSNVSSKKPGEQSKRNVNNSINCLGINTNCHCDI